LLEIVENTEKRFVKNDSVNSVASVRGFLCLSLALLEITENAEKAY
jgi:hypothetical protein